MDKTIGLKIIDFLTLLKTLLENNFMGGEEVNLIKYPALTLDDMNDNWKEWVFSLDSLIYTYFKEEGFNDGVIIFKDLPFYQRVSTYWLSKVFGGDFDCYTQHSADVIETINYIKIREHL